MNTGADTKDPFEAEAGGDTITRHKDQTDPSGSADDVTAEFPALHRRALPSGKLIVSVRQVPQQRRLSGAQRSEIIADIEALRQANTSDPSDPLPVYVLFGDDISPREFGFVYEHAAYPLDKPAGLDAALDEEDLDRAEALTFYRGPGYAAALEEANSLAPPDVVEADEVEEDGSHLAAFFEKDNGVDERTWERWKQAARTPAEI